MYTFEKEVLSCPLVFVLTLLILFAGMERPGVILTGGPRKPNTPATAAPPAAAKLTSTKLTSHSLSSHKFSTTTAAAFAATSAFRNQQQWPPAGSIPAATNCHSLSAFVHFPNNHATFAAVRNHHVITVSCHTRSGCLTTAWPRWLAEPSCPSSYFRLSWSRLRLWPGWDSLSSSQHWQQLRQQQLLKACHWWQFKRQLSWVTDIPVPTLTAQAWTNWQSHISNNLTATYCPNHK